MLSLEYEDNMRESQENLFEESTDSDIDEINDLIGNLHPYCYEPKKDAIESSKATVIHMKMSGKRFSQQC